MGLVTLILALVTSTVSPPPAAAVVDYQIGGAYAPAADVRVVDRDRGDRPVAGRYNVCYVNAFQTQPEEKSYWLPAHRHLLLTIGGHVVQDPDWPGELLMDTSAAWKRTALARIVGRWIDGCAAKGFDAIEPDNLDSWSRSHGRIGRGDNLAFAALLIARAHHDGLAIAQKNAVEVSAAGRRLGFDFAIAEECRMYRECTGYTRYYGRHVVEIEYTDNPRSAYTSACAKRSGVISILLRDRDVVARGRPGYHYEHC